MQGMWGWGALEEDLKEERQTEDQQPGEPVRSGPCRARGWGGDTKWCRPEGRTLEDLSSDPPREPERS